MTNDRYDWEWPGERDPEKKIAIEVTHIAEEKSEIFGLQNSPSLGRHLPDPVVVTGREISSDAAALSELKIRMPKLELRGAKEGDVLAVGILPGRLVICAEPIPLESSQRKEILAWLNAWDCIAGGETNGSQEN